MTPGTIRCAGWINARWRVKGNPPYELPDWKRVQSRHYEDWIGNRVVLDTSKLSVNGCVKRIIEALGHAT